jgi:limonene-1,2-epoxide hydrolase
MNKGLIFGLMTALVLILAACGAAATPTPDPTSVVRRYYQAFNERQLDAAMALVADDAVFMDQGLRYSGKSEIRASVESAVNDFVTVEVSNLSDTDGRVTYDFEVFFGESRDLTGTGVMVVRDGKIIFDGTEADLVAECDRDASQTFCAES